MDYSFVYQTIYIPQHAASPQSGSISTRETWIAGGEEERKVGKGRL